MKISIDSIIDEAKFNLGLRDTSYADADLERLINQAAIHLDATNSYVINCTVLDVDCYKAKLPDEYTELICIKPTTTTGCCGTCNIDYDPETDTSPTSLGCGCYNYYAFNRNVLTNFCGMGASCGGGNIMDTQNGYLIFPSSFTATEITLWYRGYNVDSEGIMVFDELQERGLAAYASYKYASAGQNIKAYAPQQLRDWKMEWNAQKNWLKGKAAQRDHKQHKVKVASIARAILVNPWNVADRNL